MIKDEFKDLIYKSCALYAEMNRTLKTFIKEHGGLIITDENARTEKMADSLYGYIFCDDEVLEKYILAVKCEDEEDVIQILVEDGDFEYHKEDINSPNWYPIDYGLYGQNLYNLCEILDEYV